MSTLRGGPINFNPIVTTEKVANVVRVDREHDVLNRRDILQVSCTTRNRYHVRRIIIDSDMEETEQRILAVNLMQFIKADIGDEE